MAGNTLGPRAKFIYRADDGRAFVMTLDEDLGLAAGLPTRDATNGAAATRAPSRFKPRVVFCEATVTTGAGDGASSRLVRKELICNAASPLYNTAAAQAVTIDGLEFITTGRRGEKLSF